MCFIEKKRRESHDLWAERAEFVRENPKLPVGTVLDREKSVNWNEQEAARLNRSRQSKRASFQAKINACDKAISEKIIEYVRSEYEFSEAVANIVFDAAYERGHADGYEDVVSYAQEYAEFAERLYEAWS